MEFNAIVPHFSKRQSSEIDFNQVEMVVIKAATYAAAFFIAQCSPITATIGLVIHLVSAKDANTILWAVRNTWNRMSFAEKSLASIVAFVFASEAIMIVAGLVGMYVGQVVVPCKQLPAHGFLDQFVK